MILYYVVWGTGLTVLAVVIAFRMADKSVKKFNDGVVPMSERPPKKTKPKLVVVDRNFRPPTPVPPTQRVMTPEERQRAALKAILGVTGIAIGEIDEPDKFDQVLDRIAQLARAGLITRST